MTEQHTFLNAKEFSEKTGISSSTVTKLLRNGKINGEKKSGKWFIPNSELTSPAVLELTGKQPADPAPEAKEAVSSKKYSVSEFSKMTYLTEKGVLQWLNQGRLKGGKTSQGEWVVDAANLDIPDVGRLVRGN